jgi:hypothetical protein
VSGSSKEPALGHSGRIGVRACAIRDATAITRQSVCWRLKKHANFIAANFISLWPTRGFRSPVGMRQWTICSRVGTSPKPVKTDGLVDEAAQLGQVVDTTPGITGAD